MKAWEVDYVHTCFGFDPYGKAMELPSLGKAVLVFSEHYSKHLILMLILLMSRISPDR